MLNCLYESPSEFDELINCCLTFLRIAAETTPSKSEHVIRPVAALRELVSFVIPKTKVRPVATLIVNRSDWYVTDLKTGYTANETSSKSFLGAFLGVSIFDDREMLGQFETVQELNSEARSHIATTLRRRLEGPRGEMFLLVETLLKDRVFPIIVECNTHVF